MKAATVATGSLLALALAVGADSNAATQASADSRNALLQPFSDGEGHSGLQILMKNPADDAMSDSSISLAHGLSGRYLRR